MNLALLNTSSRSSVERAPARCLGGRRFDSSQEFRFFSLFQVRGMMNIPSFKQCIVHSICFCLK